MLTACDASPSSTKARGAYFTPPEVAETLVRWAVPDPSDRLLDPSCGDGRFLACHRNSTGVERDASAAAASAQIAPWSRIHVADFFDWAQHTEERFDCAAGNPPFIRYQLFSGDVRERAIRLCLSLGARFTRLASSWAPFLVVAASRLNPGGRMAFLVPAEVGHAPYSAPLIDFLTRHFSRVQFVAIREKIFPELSEDVWILFATGFGGTSNEILLTIHDAFASTNAAPPDGYWISVAEWRSWNYRLRPFLVNSEARSLYQSVQESDGTKRLGEIARVGIGYVTGANDFFHLRPSDAKAAGIPDKFLLPAVRNAASLPDKAVTTATVDRWFRQDKAALLLRLPPADRLQQPVVKYLDSPAGRKARETYKCRNRRPWYAVPDVRVPDAFLSYMCGRGPSLVANHAGCTCTNSIHAVELRNGRRITELAEMWRHPLTELSCELEGHPLGGGMLKLEPREASRIVLPIKSTALTKRDRENVREAVATLRRWRHYD